MEPLGNTYDCGILSHEEFAREILTEILCAFEPEHDVDDVIGLDSACDYLVKEYGWALVHACGSCDGTVWVHLPTVVAEPQREALVRLVPALDGLI